MMVRCIADKLSDEQKILLRIAQGHSTSYQLQIGSDYLVLALTFSLPTEPYGGGAEYQILNGFGVCRSVPACLFNVIDNRASEYWRVRQDEDGSLLLWPEEFFVDFFHDDLSEGRLETVNSFKKVVQKLQREFESG
ncbi:MULTISPECIES: hypothetical protein [Corallococcus]|uniref:hypothetical protein n=1 Tax=Corallococcus TaxID=83461 RepID=UPI0011C47FD4|nr:MULTISPECIES: hypothetical protein [Corallococcus]